MGVELPLRVVVTILECCVTFSGVKLSIRSFVLLQEGLSCESSVRISKFSGEIMKGQSKVIVQVIFHNNGDLKNSSK